MRPKLFFLLALAAMFLNVSCPEDDFFIDVLEISMDPDIEIAVGDSIQFTANFSANLSSGNKIGSNGGIVVFYVFRLDSVNNILTEAVSVSELDIIEGEPLTTVSQLDDAGHYFRYRCPDENCQFSVTWHPQEPGMYMVKPEGLGFEGLPIAQENNGEEQNFFVETRVINAPNYTLEYPWLLNRNYNYQSNNGFLRTYTFFEGSLLYFEVE